ncbi:AfsR/SARP family transcriptional regulator [Dactylosporangium sp. CA-092794]|uniref:AfsR/SARP family transcriptional regulator n=1 Tax=Dactylosporangium sp. CA-092794 TaxID=3239929 RepID=UPI003D89CC75
MRFLVLGPLSLQDGDERRINAAKPRGLLAVLLINANQVVTVDRLIDELWGERPPPTACNLIRQYISQVRKVLPVGAGDGAELRTHAAGYMLTLGRTSLDAAEFEHLAHHARAQLSGDRPAEARATIGRALRLWRGSAFADVPTGPSAAAERLRLDELHSSVRELSAEADLAAGHLSEAIGELTVLTAHFPLHERPYLLLMRALSRAGRKADALAVYRSARNTLVSEVGLEPGLELRDAERQILALAG